MIIKIKRKLFTKWDDTDRLKEMKDSDILAEKKRSTGYGSVVSGAAGTALGLGAAGAVGGAAYGLSKMGKVSGVANKARMVGRMAGGIAGKAALGGALIGGTIALAKRSKKSKENQFYNDRLEYAQRQARRREKKDWKTNMTQREGYTY